MSEYVWNEKESKKSRLARRKVEREVKDKEAECFMDSLRAGVDAPPFPTLSKETERRLVIPEGCVGMLIGKKGENIRNVEQRLKVTIRIEDVTTSAASPPQARPRGGPRSGAQQAVVITGVDPHAVAMAERELDFATDELEVPSEMVAWVVGRGGKHLKKIQELSGAAVVSLRRSESEQEEQAESSSPERCWFDLKGRREAVADAKMCLEAHMGYYPVYAEMQEAEEELDRDIAEAQQSLGVRRKPQAQGGGGGRGAPGNALPSGGAGARSAKAKGAAAEGAPEAKGRGRGRGAGPSAGGGRSGGDRAKRSA